MTRRADPFVREPIGEAHRDGRYHVVLDQADRFALLRWADGHWLWSNGQQAEFTPTHAAVANRDG